MIDWVSIVRQSNRRFSNCMYFVPRSRRHRQKQQQRINVTIPDPDDGDRSTGCFKVRADGIFFTWRPLRQGNANVFIGHTRPSKLIDTRFFFSELMALPVIFRALDMRRGRNATTTRIRQLVRSTWSMEPRPAATTNKIRSFLMPRTGSSSSQTTTR